MKKGYISREDAYRAICNLRFMNMSIAEFVLDDIPNAPVKQIVNGRWIAESAITRYTVYKCSGCNEKFYTMMKFCPECGADMQQGQWKRCYEGIGWDCPKCGAHSESRTKYCSKCGEQLMS